MNNLYGDGKKYISAENLQAVDRFGNEQLLPTSIDWIDVVQPCTGAADGTITFTNADFSASETFKVGDKLRVFQLGSYIYFYVIATTDSTILVTAGTDYGISAIDPIINLAYSRLENPTDFPPVFNFAANPHTAGVNALAQTPSSLSYTFWMVGRMATIDVHFDNDTLSSDNTSIIIDLPVPANSGWLLNANVPFYPCFAVNDGGLQTAGAKLGSLTSDKLEVVIVEFPGTAGFGTWLTSVGQVGMDVTLTYLV